MNDETPTFQSTYYEAEVNENVQENAPLTFIAGSRNSVIDRDQVKTDLQNMDGALDSSYFLL